MKKNSAFALLPFLVFVILYFGGSVYAGDFYALPAPLIFLAAVIIALLQFPKDSFEKKLNAFAQGAGDPNIMIMIIIFLLAGIFGEISRGMGAVESAVNFGLQYIAPRFMPAALFAIAAFISLSLGTSVGTIAVLAPFALGIEQSAPGHLGILLGAVVGGSMFGDNLSFISDTTIAATRTQGIGMREKFRTNIKIVWIPALLSVLAFIFLSTDLSGVSGGVRGSYTLPKILPYLVVFVLALLGLNVIWTLLTGIISSLVIGFFYQDFSALEALQMMGKGMSSMFEISIICLLIGGMVGIIRHNGGISYILAHLKRRTNSAKSAQLTVAALTAAVNACTANNTIAIIIVGPIAKEMSDATGAKPRSMASIMDTISCFVQGVLPYGAQILTALSIVSFSVSPWEVIQYLFYPFLIGVFIMGYILLQKGNPMAKER